MVEAGSVESQDLRRQKMKKYIIYGVAFVIFQVIVLSIMGLTIMKFRNPKFRVRSATFDGAFDVGTAANPSFNITMNTKFGVRNNNFGPFKYQNATVDFYYRNTKSAPGQEILFTKNEDHQSVDVYTDADWAGAVDDMRSTSGYFTFVGGNLVTRRSKKQNVVARSSAEAEFRVIALGVCEALWLRLLLQDLGCVSKQPVKLYCDNKTACDIAHNLVQHDRTKHVEIDRFFIKEKLDEKIVELPHIRSEDQLTDILTKAVSSRVFSKFLSKLGMWDIYAPT
ncbi:hypothetical protein RJ640_023136 [Escallonia rubra]|uniref:Uncharacterized protein n=1 Tax=Escallonia rubra TaxID=112253 RepID=A0AA88R7I2_9ASTE|nr:hypothetical protein RJ640_023136 [Escallonia rubra]